jgi:5-methylcytosine-specific restriction endonuclease McrA
MKALHIVQGGIDNGDKALLEKASKEKLDARTWVAPKSSKPGDDVVIYIAGYGFFATATIKSSPKPRRDWPNRYGAELSSIKLISPAISLGAIRRKVPDLRWANYPRSITTVKTDVAKQVKDLISLRRKTRIPDYDDDALSEANIDELRKIAILKARRTVTAEERKVLDRARSLAIKLYVLRRSNGLCEGCSSPAPFQKPDGTPYLEPHHTSRLADDGPDHPCHVIALCPNCHRRAHYSADSKAFNKRLTETVFAIEARYGD